MFTHCAGLFKRESEAAVAIPAVVLTNITAVYDITSCGMLCGWIKVSLDTAFTILRAKTLVSFTSDTHPIPDTDS